MLLLSHWSVSPSGGGRHEAVVRARRRAAELKGSARKQRLTPCSSVRLRKRLRAAKAEGCSGWVKGSVHAEASAHSVALCCRRPGALVVGTTSLHHPVGQQHTLGYFWATMTGFTSLTFFLSHPSDWLTLLLPPRCVCCACEFVWEQAVYSRSFDCVRARACVHVCMCVSVGNNVNVTAQ